MSAMVQYNKYDESLLSSRKYNGHISRPAHEKQFAKSVEAALYAYPIWKVSFEQFKCLYESRNFENRYINKWHEDVVDEMGSLRQEYVLCVKLIEKTLIVLSPIQREFIQQRYFKKMPFKIIAEEMAMVERHLYRIRQDVIRVFSMSFGWQ